MHYTPDYPDGTFTLKGDNTLGWTIFCSDGAPLVHLSAQLIDGSNTGKWKDGVIRTREQREAEARWVLEALNAYASRPLDWGEFLAVAVKGNLYALLCQKEVTAWSAVAGLLRGEPLAMVRRVAADPEGICRVMAGNMLMLSAGGKSLLIHADGSWRPCEVEPCDNDQDT